MVPTIASPPPELAPNPPLAGGHGEACGHTQSCACQNAVQVEPHGSRGLVPHVGDVRWLRWRRHRWAKRGSPELRVGVKPSWVVSDHCSLPEIAVHVGANGQVGAGTGGRITFHDEFHRRIAGNGPEVERGPVHARQSYRRSEGSDGPQATCGVEGDNGVVATERCPRDAGPKRATPPSGREYERRVFKAVDFSVQSCTTYQ